MKKEPSRKAQSMQTGFQAPPNAVHEEREKLGLTKVDLARLADLSDRTIARVERRKQNFSNVTYWRILNALNKARHKEGLEALRYEDVYPTAKIA